jgi:tripartite-type tricarboxylate transporter receptor subunit TctC
MAINQLIMKNLSYDFEKDFTVLGLIANAPHVLAVRADLPYKNVNELVTAAKKEPGKYTFASSGIGTIVQMAGELFRLEAGIDMLHVPFKGGGPATQALLSGDVDMTVNDMTTLKALLADGRLRPLAVAHTQRMALLPDTPTFKEIGLGNVVSSTWWGLAVPSATPGDIQKVLKEAHNKIIQDPAYKARLQEMAVETLALSDAEIKQFMKGEVDKWARIVKFANITPN